MRILKAIFSFHPGSGFYLVSAILSFIYILAHFYPGLILIADVALVAGLLTIITDLSILILSGKAIEVRRYTSEKMSNGDLNKVSLFVKSTFPYKTKLEIIDEIPVQFQQHNFSLKLSLPPKGEEIIEYQLRPVRRGEYHFGSVRAFVFSPLGFFDRRFDFNQKAVVPVYPSFIQMKRYSFMAQADRLSEAGVRRVRKSGQNTEFDKIREYVKGDDYRLINWKATARKNAVMVNHYIEEKAQSICSVIDMGRTMIMPFDGMTLVDYSINSTLVLSNIALHKQDRAGLLAFDKKVKVMLVPEKRGGQMNQIMEALYNLEPAFAEPDYESLYAFIDRKLNRRSLLIFYTNFESLPSLERRIPVFTKLARKHLLFIVFFENTGVKSLTEKTAENTDEMYQRGIAEKYFYEKRQMVVELQRIGAIPLLTSYSNLTVNVINKYLEIKARNLL